MNVDSLRPKGHKVVDRREHGGEWLMNVEKSMGESG